MEGIKAIWTEKDNRNALIFLAVFSVLTAVVPLLVLVGLRGWVVFGSGSASWAKYSAGSAVLVANIVLGAAVITAFWIDSNGPEASQHDEDKKKDQ